MHIINYLVWQIILQMIADYGAIESYWNIKTTTMIELEIVGCSSSSSVIRHHANHMATTNLGQGHGGLQLFSFLEWEGTQFAPSCRLSN